MVVCHHHLQQIPDLLLALVEATGVASDVALGHFIAQPVAGACHDAHVLGHQPHFLTQFPKHGLLGCLATVDAALRKLPAVGANALAPKHLVALVEQDDADIGSEPFSVEHNQTSKF